MVMCSRCKKRAAVVFITKMEGNEAKNEGLCLKCAKELKIPNVDMMMNQLGINDDEIDNISDQMEDMFSQMGDEDFTPGGAPSMEFFNRLMSDIKADADAGGAHLGSAAKGKGSDFLHPFHVRLSFF